MGTRAASEGGKDNAALAMASALLRFAAVFGVLLLIAGVLVFTWAGLRCASAVLAYPFGVDYGEGIVWQQALLIPGPRMYGPIDQMPFIVFHYPPLYHLASRGVMALGVDPLAAGRGVSLAATAVIVLCIAWLVAADLSGRVGRSAVLVGAVVGALLPISFRPVAFWFDLMRVDMLAIALAFLGVVFAVRAERRPAWLALAIPAFVLSVFSKQTELAAPVAALAVLLMVRPRAVIVAGLGGGLLGLAALGWLEWLTAGGFLRHILSYNVNTWSFETMARNMRQQRPYGLLLAAAVAGLAMMWLSRGESAKPHGAGTARYTVVVPIVAAWLLLSLVLLVATVGKTGASINYFIEPMCVCAIAAGLIVGRSWQAAIASSARGALVLRLGVVLIPFALLAVMAARRPVCPLSEDRELIAIQENLVQEIARQDRPVLSEDMVLLMRGGREVPLEPSIFRELTLTGQWDQRHILDLIDARAFAFLVTTPDKFTTPERYTPEVLAAIARAYPRVQIRGPYAVRYPESP